MASRAGVFVVPGRYTSTARSDNGGTVSATASLYHDRVRPGSSIVRLPLNVRGRPCPARIPSSLSRSAMWAAPIVSGALPNVLLSTTRSRDPRHARADNLPQRLVREVDERRRRERDAGRRYSRRSCRRGRSGTCAGHERRGSGWSRKWWVLRPPDERRRPRADPALGRHWAEKPAKACLPQRGEELQRPQLEVAFRSSLVCVRHRRHLPLWRRAYSRILPEPRILFSQFLVRPAGLVMEQPQLIGAAARGKMRALRPIAVPPSSMRGHFFEA